MESKEKDKRKLEKEGNANEYEGKFPCPLCYSGLIIKSTKNNRPYCVCLSCGIQLFIRGKEGINKLKAYLRKNYTENPENAENLPSISNSKRAIRILNQIEEIKSQIDKIEENMGFWDTMCGNEEKEQVLQILKAESAKLKKELKNLS